MKSAADSLLLQEFLDSMSELVKVYRSLFQQVRKEKEVLISMDLQTLNESNRQKEALLVKARSLEAQRARCSFKLAHSEAIPTENLVAENFVKHFGGDVGERIQTLQSVLRVLLERIRKVNRENQRSVQSALSHVQHSMKSAHELLSENRVYQKQGKTKEAQTSSGNLVNRQV